VTNDPPSPISPEPLPGEIREHYEHEIDEAERLSRGLDRLELVRTREVVRRHLPVGPLRVLDVGGGTGVHARWLADDGHHVHVVDPVGRHVEQVGRLGSELGTITAELGDARDLSAPDESVDAVLLFGPLYHLTARADRVRSLCEAARVVRVGGLVFVAAISRFASLFDGLARGLLFEDGFPEVVERDLRDGQHRNPARRPHWFTTAYFHRPDDLRAEATEAGLDVVELVGLEGLAGWLPALAERWDEGPGTEIIVSSARAIEYEPSLLGLSAHLLLVARRVTSASGVASGTMEG
jgi:ubiquinone/menaquinone biosynthesis C-methylase UbiE